MTTPNIDAFMPYSIQFETSPDSVALTISDPAQRNTGGVETHVLTQGTYVVQMSYDGPGACRLVWRTVGEWVERARVEAGEAYRPRSTVTNLTVPKGTLAELKLWADSTAGYSGSLTVTPMPNYKK